MVSLIKIASVALIVTLITTPLMRRLALRLGIVDRPDQRRKLHARCTPLGGGVAVFVGAALTLVAVWWLSPTWRQRLLEESTFLWGLGIAASLVLLVGLIDDRFGMHGRHKLLGQLAACGVLLYSGLHIDELQVFDTRLVLGVMSIPFTIFWLLGATNALNLLDGMDGLAGSIGAILCGAIAIMALVGGHPTDAILAAALAGAVLGFLAYNLPPASLFLGDAGAMLIGLVIGALAIRCSLKGPATVALAAPTAIMAIPILDVCMAIMRRKLTGRSIYTTDRGHLHHSLQRRGYHGLAAVGLVGFMCLSTAGAAVVSVAMNNEWLAHGAVAVVVATLIVSGLFGRQETLLLLRRTKTWLSALLHFDTRRRGAHSLQVRLQGNRQWEELWNTLIDYAERFDLNRIQLNVALPALGEEYHATWHRKGADPEAQLWTSDIPLVANRLAVGRLRLTGTCSHEGVCAWMGDLIAGLKPFESHMLQILNDCAQNLLKEQSVDHRQVETATPQVTVPGGRAIGPQHVPR